MPDPQPTSTLVLDPAKWFEDFEKKEPVIYKNIVEGVEAWRCRETNKLTHKEEDGTSKIFIEDTKDVSQHQMDLVQNGKEVDLYFEWKPGEDYHYIVTKKGEKKPKLVQQTTRQAQLREQSQQPKRK